METDKNEHVISEGDQIIIKTNKILKVFQARKKRVLRVEKIKFTLDSAIGQPFGSTFEVKEGKLSRIVGFCQDEDRATDKDIERDNRSLTDTADNQKLKKADIQALRKEGASGQEIVDQLVENSSTFKKKTEFAQEKYIKKKKKKHVTTFTILKPTTRLLAQMYFSKGPTKICNLRYDSIAQILTQANVRAGSKLIVFESVTGLLVGAITERLGGHGKIVQLYSGSAPSRQAMEPFGFSTQEKQVLCSFPLNKVSTLSREQCKCGIRIKNPQKCSEAAENGTSATKDECLQQDMKTDIVNTNKTTSRSTDDSNRDGDSLGVEELTENKEANSTSDSTGANMEVDSADSELVAIQGAEDDGDGLDKDEEGESDEQDADQSETCAENNKRKCDWEAEKERRRKYRQAEDDKSRHLLESADMDGLIVASKWYPTPIVLSLIGFVAPSRPIVVFCQYKEPLLDCYVKLRNRGGIVNLRLTETWLRHYQVLPNRTHPEVNMSGAGGYLLTGTTVIGDSQSS